MKNIYLKKGLAIAAAAVLLAGCSASAAASSPAVSSAASQSTNTSGTSTVTTVNASANAVIDTADLFTSRDLEQSVDTSNAEYITLENNKDISITSEGVYIISGTSSETTITVEAPEDAKVQIVLAMHRSQIQIPLPSM